MVFPIKRKNSLTHKVDKSLYAGIIYAKNVDNSATVTNELSEFSMQSTQEFNFLYKVGQERKPHPPPKPPPNHLLQPLPVESAMLDYNFFEQNCAQKFQ
jgi:hypothetical protein